jgi:hypothetical protein
VIQISVVLPTLRKNPRFQEMADALAVNLEALRTAGVPGELQWVIVDGRLWYEDPAARRAQVLDAVRGRFHVVHVEPKPSVWQGPYRLTRRDLWDKASASNTGLCYADGPCVVFVDDCSIFNEEFLLCHYETTFQGLAACGGYRYLRPGARVEAGRLVEASFEEPGDHRLLAQAIAGPCAPGWMYGGNASCPLEAALIANGFDEIMSGQGGLEDCEFGLRIARVVPLWFLPGALAYQLMETHEVVGDYLGHEPDPLCNCGHSATKHLGFLACDQCRCGEYKARLPERCKGFPYRDGNGVLHHMSDNHRPIYRLQGMRIAPAGDAFQPVPDGALEEETRRVRTIGNGFDLRELRAAVRGGRHFPVPGEPKKDWRDGQPLEDM